MDWAAFWGAIMGGSITAMASWLISKKTIKADLEKSKNEINAKFNIEVKANSAQEWIDKLRENIADLVAIAYDSTNINFNISATEINKKNITIMNSFTLRKSYIELMLTGSNGKPDEEKLLLLLNNQNDAICCFFNHITRLEYIDMYNDDNNTKESHIKLHKKINDINLKIIETGKIILKKEYDKKNSLIDKSR